ncbi:siroheme synthase CysG [Rhodovulum euryhalinum]|uniref:Uroporphyrin-III C-methyltransferase/precorrin-2 dehydrogenase/sirohydrochlorin ferrochelatase n=1 Tax=Rhodovulum euryhalinum TaxID=35805 RepID=A0A4R2KLS8_9RHOB|nr:siroheme synthase CysG [Rhodovulum euryhalinum]TCO71656.1 uroporphyrin-III C-methyltransferase/precorrin-2 dehydrogenase/sirohydrochlorin ferrochelatase [Rhodovulum euryhalinum]
MKYFPIFLRVAGLRVAVSGGGAAAVAKLRLLLKTEARIEVYAETADPLIASWAAEGRLRLVPRAIGAADLPGLRLVYAANEDAAEDGRVAALAAEAGVPFNIVDNLEASAFLTPALVDRDPLVIAIGTEGAGPVLARKIKALLEERLPAGIGDALRAAKALRPAAEALLPGRARRAFWSAVFDRALAGDAAPGAAPLLDAHLDRAPAPGRVLFVGAGPGDPDELTLRARRALDAADVVIHDRLVPQPILELARREAEIVEAGKTGFGPSTPQDAINRLIVERARAGALVVRLKAGDPGVFGRLDEEIAACEAAGLDWSILPGITAASAAAASLGQSLTRRGRNSELRVITGQDVEGLADHDWAALARPGAVAAIYMGKRAARFIQGRLMMHGADPATPVSVVENAGRPGERIVATRLGAMAADLAAADLRGPAVIMLGLAPRAVAALASAPLSEAAR